MKHAASTVLQEYTRIELSERDQETHRLVGGLLRWNQYRNRRDTLPRAVDFHPGIDKALAVHIRLAFVHTLAAKYSGHYGRIAVDLDCALFRYGLRGVVVGRFD